MIQYGFGRSELADVCFAAIHFPSDALSIGRLRQEHPDLFDAGYAEGSGAQPVFLLRPMEAGHVADTVGSLLYLERFVVASSYAEARDLPLPDGEAESLKEELAGLYLRYRLALNANHAQQLIEELEAAGRQEVTG